MINYTNTLDKALSYLRELELDKAFLLFYKLLDEHPKDLELINRIYALESNNPQSPGYLRICLHIFSLQTSQTKLKQMILNTFSDFKKHIGQYDFDEQHTFSLIHHLAMSHFQQDTDKLVQKIKHCYATDKRVPDVLFYYCKSLITKNKFIQASKELRYLITYYGEHPVAALATTELKRIESLIVW